MIHSFSFVWWLSTLCVVVLDQIKPFGLTLPEACRVDPTA